MAIVKQSGKSTCNQELDDWSWWLQEHSGTDRPPNPRPDYPLCRLYHGRGPLPVGALISCQIFNTLFWRLNVRTFSVGLNRGKLHRQRKFWLRVREKGPPPYVGMPPPQLLIRPCPNLDIPCIWVNPFNQPAAIQHGLLSPSRLYCSTHKN